MSSSKLLLDRITSLNTFAPSVTRTTFAHDAFPTRHRTGAFCEPEDGGIPGPAGMTRAENSFTRMKLMFHLGSGTWCRLGCRLAIGVGLVAMLGASFAAELSSRAFPPLLSAGGSGDSLTPLVSDDGRFVVFVSAAENLAPNDGNQFMDVFLRDRETGSTTLLSTDDSGQSWRQAHSMAPSISADAGKIAFVTRVATLLVVPNTPDATYTNQTCFLIDRVTGSRTLVGLADPLEIPVAIPTRPEVSAITYRNLASNDPRVSPDGRRCFFRVPYPAAGSVLPYGSPHIPTDLWFALDPGQGATNVFAAGLSGTLTPGGHYWELPFPNSETDDVRFAFDANRMAFSSSANNLHSLDGLENGSRPDVFVYNGATRSNVLVSISADGTRGGSDNSTSPDISADGRFVVFASTATNLVAADTNANADIFLRDLTLETTVLVSSNLAGVTTASSGQSGAPALSADGRWIAFFSNASDLVPDDPNGAAGDVFLRDNESGIVTRISDHPAWLGRLAGSAQPPKLTPDGSFVLYQAPGSGLFLYERATGLNRLLTEDVTTDAPAMSPDGRFVVFSSRTVPGLIGGTDAHRQIYLFDRELDSFELISVRDEALPRLTANDGSRFEAGVLATADDLLLVRSYATDLGFRAEERKLRLWNLTDPALPLEVDLGSIDGTPVEVAKTVNLTASADGRWLAFDYDEPTLAESQGNHGWHVVLHDRQTGRNRVLNHTAGLYRGPQFPAIAPDGSKVVWRPSAAGLDQFDIASGTHTRLIANDSILGAEEAPILAAFETHEYRHIVFRYRGFGIPGLTQEAIPNWRALRLDTLDGTLAHLDPLPLGSSLEEVSLIRAQPFVHNGKPLYAGHVEIRYSSGRRDIHPFSPLLVGDVPLPAPAQVDRWNPFNLGASLVFDSSQALSGLEDTNQVSDVYIHSSSGGPQFPELAATELVSVNIAGTGAGNGPSTVLGVSSDERFILFHSLASDLVANDTNQLGDLFLRDRRTQTTLMLTAGLNGSTADGTSTRRAMFTRDGTKVIFESYARNLARGDYNETRDVFTATLALPDSDGDGLPDSWELTWFGTLDRDGSGDADGDGALDRDEFLAGTSPINDTSVLAALPIQSGSGGEPVIVWAAVPGRTYRVQYKDDFNEPGWATLPGDVSADSSTGHKRDQTGSVTPQRFYRVLILP